MRLNTASVKVIVKNQQRINGQHLKDLHTTQIMCHKTVVHQSRLMGKSHLDPKPALARLPHLPPLFPHHQRQHHSLLLPLPW